MSVFQIQKEDGFSRILQSRDNINTPMFLTTLDGLKNKQVCLKTVVLAENGVVPLNLSFSLDTLSDNIELERIHQIDEWSILVPRLTQNYVKLKVSYEEELRLFISRIEELDLPSAFGLSYDPLHDPDSYLKSILSLGPSIIALRTLPIEKLSPNKLIELIMTARKRIPPNIAIYIPGGVPIGYQGLMIGMGIDILDDGAAYRGASQNRSYFDGFSRKDNKSDRLDLIDLNKKELNREFQAIVASLSNNTLWSRISRDMHSFPSVASAIKVFSKNYLFQMETSRISAHKGIELQFTGDEDLYHPDVIKFHSDITKRYRINSKKRLIVLLPCSAKKPYRESKSHKVFTKAIKKAARREFHLVEIWSLTSPIGVVPQDLETVYPSAFYDLPVTGEWSEEESQVTGKVLKEMLSHVPSEIGIIIHVSKGYQRMVEIGTSNREVVYSWVDKSPTSYEAQDNLREKIAGYFHTKSEDRFKEKSSFIHKSSNEINSLLRYTHGKNVELSLTDVKFLGRPPRPLQAKIGNDHFFSWDSLHGKVNLAPKAAIKIATTSDNWILTDTNELKGSTLFSVGILDASEKISPNDEVLIFNSDKTLLLGVGNAVISGYTMNRVDSGIAAKIRKKCSLEVKSI